MEIISKAFKPLTKTEDEAKDAQYALLSHLISIYSINEIHSNNSEHTVVITASENVMASIIKTVDELMYQYEITEVLPDEDIAKVLTDEIQGKSETIKELTHQLKETTSSETLFRTLAQEHKTKNVRIRKQITAIAQLLNSFAEP